MTTCKYVQNIYIINSIWNNILFPENRSKIANISTVWQIGMAKALLISVSVFLSLTGNLERKFLCCDSLAAGFIANQALLNL
jgi:hypothetical protein